nr:MAG TPA: hypothetical protein [Caudoviricetes sp.]
MGHCRPSTHSMSMERWNGGTVHSTNCRGPSLCPRRTGSPVPTCERRAVP